MIWKGIIQIENENFCSRQNRRATNKQHLGGVHTYSTTHHHHPIAQKMLQKRRGVLCVQPYNALVCSNKQHSFLRIYF